MNFTTKLSEQLRQKVGNLSPLRNVKPVGGGDINECLRLDFDERSVFVKKNSDQAYPRMFDLEARALEELRNESQFAIPQVIMNGCVEDEAFLILEFLEEGRKEPGFWEDFGAKLAMMHRPVKPAFGWHTDNYMGRLVQANDFEDQWADFFATRRIEPQLKMARESGLLQGDDLRRAARFLEKVESLVPAEPAALIHGDLWAGNYMVAPDGSPALIDPALHYGHREADIAMMHLFGGFSPEVFEAYNRSYPLEAAWRERLDIHNLYPVLVHLNLFGASYAAQVRATLKKHA